jgi:hypothetical protein
VSVGPKLSLGQTGCEPVSVGAIFSEGLCFSGASVSETTLGAPLARVANVVADHNDLLTH